MTRCGRVMLVMVAACVGCSDRSPRAEDFVPSEVAARSALDASLKAWVEGGPNARVPATVPTVEVSDGLRTPGRTLVKYDILGPVPAEAERCFAVRLTLGNPAQELRERYVVLGIDPLWVWRYDDFLMLTHWDHAMIADKDKKPGPAPKR